MHHALSPTPADETGIALAKIQFEQQSPAGLIAWYNKQQKLGMVGVHRQVLHCTKCCRSASATAPLWWKAAWWLASAHR